VPLALDAACRSAIDLAKRSVPVDTPLDAATLLAALYHGAGLAADFPALAQYLHPPNPLRTEVPAKVPVAADLQPILQRLADGGREITSRRMFEAVLASEAGRAALRALGVPEEDVGAATDAAAPAPGGWRSSPERAAAIEALASFGRMLTASDPPHGRVVEREGVLRSLIRTLSKMKRRNAILIGPAGCGKSAIVYELARRLHSGDSSLPPRLRDLDVFELSPTFLRSGASMVGQYDERVKALLEVLRANPKIILFVDEIHSLFQSGVHARGPFTDANESFKAALGRGEVTCLGCTTTGEYRHHIEPDRALERRFAVIRIDPPSREETVGILNARRPRMEEYYGSLRIPGGIVERVVALTEEQIPGRSQPDKSIQLLDEACAFCATADPPLEEVTEEMLVRALEDMTGRSIVRTAALTEEQVLDRLRESIVGQDGALREIARAFVAGLGQWSKRSGPRGVFLFLGPTGVGKTETALALSRVLGGGRENLVRVDCNILHASAFDSGPAINRLIGVPPGYVGYARGQGGLLSRVRDLPESVVLFDEFEKAGSAIAPLLLQIIDDGRIEDVDGNILDFRRSFIVFTTNAGCGSAQQVVGFGGQGRGAAREAAEADPTQELRALGVGEEFLGRMTHVVEFRQLDGDSIRTILERLLQSLRQASETRGLALTWSPSLVAYLAERWQPRFGVRFAAGMLRHRIGEQLDVAEAQGELRGIRSIHLDLIEDAASGNEAPAGLAKRERSEDRLILRIA
jgi:ATP-dependent Clp protease ATP-binding subunit ClpA